MDKSQKDQLRFIKLLKKECGEQFKLVDAYHDYLNTFYEKHKEEITKNEEQILANIKESEKILQGFDLVKFIAKDNKLVCAFEKDEKQIAITIDSINKSDTRSTNESIKLVEKHIQACMTELYEINKQEQIIIEELHRLKKEEPEKVLGVFVTQKAKDRVQKRFENEQKKLRNKLRDIYQFKKSTLFNIEVYESMIFRFKAMNEFVKSLTPKQKQEINEKYEQISELYKKNEALYKNLELVEDKKMSLSRFIKKKTKSDPKWEMLSVLKLINLLFNTLPKEDLKGDFVNLKNFFDFGKYQKEIETVLEAMDKGEFGKISRSDLSKFESDYLKKLAEQEKAEQEKANQENKKNKNQKEKGE